MGSQQSLPHGGGLEEPELDAQRLRHIKRMDMRLQAKLRQGVQYNMKVLIRGAPGVGKTALWHRLQGQSIGVGKRDKGDAWPVKCATINWAPRGNLYMCDSNCTVKVEVWDVNEAGLEVYTKAQACLVVIDPYRAESVEFAAKRVAEAPPNCCMACLINFRDKVAIEGGATLSRFDIEARLTGTHPRLMVFETSMADCYGLGLLYDYLALPFEHLKLSEQVAALQRTRDTLAKCQAVLAAAVVTHSYQSHLDTISSNKTGAPDVENMEDSRCRPFSQLAAKESVGPSVLQLQPTQSPRDVCQAALEEWLDEREDDDVDTISKPSRYRSNKDDLPGGEGLNVIEDDEFYGPTRFYDYCKAPQIDKPIVDVVDSFAVDAPPVETSGGLKTGMSPCILGEEDQNQVASAVQNDEPRESANPISICRRVVAGDVEPSDREISAAAKAAVHSATAALAVPTAQTTAKKKSNKKPAYKHPSECKKKKSKRKNAHLLTASAERTPY